MSSPIKSECLKCGYYDPSQSTYFKCYTSSCPVKEKQNKRSAFCPICNAYVKEGYCGCDRKQK